MSREAMKLALEEMKVGNYNSAAERLETALAEQPAQQEPFGYGRIWWDAKMFVPTLPSVRDGGWLPLYTSPSAQRKPLTDEAIATVYWGATGQSLRPQDNVLAHNFARSIEAAHGIKENT